MCIPSGRFALRVLSSCCLAALPVTHLAGADMYPSESEAREAYNWLHPQLYDYFSENSGWAIDGLDPDAAVLPPGVLAQYSLSPGWATFGVALPAGAASGGLEVGNLPTQVDVKSRWSDGSIRFAVVTAQVGQSGDYEMRAAPGSGGGFSPQLPVAAAVNFAIGSSDYSADLPSMDSDDLWLDGPLVKEWRWVIAPEDGGGNQHPFLRVRFDYREYTDGFVRVDVAVENILNLSQATSEDYDVEVVVGGQTVFQKTNLDHWYLTRWRKVFAAGSGGLSTITPDFESFHRARAMPRFLADAVNNEVYSFNDPTYEILGRGANSYDNMGATGGRRELAPYPAGAAQYVVHKTQNQRDWVLINGDLAGSWPVHILEPDGSFLSLEDRPDFWFDPRGDDQPAGDMDARGPLKPDNGHQPSWPYIPYLVSGDRYYSDEMAFWGNYAMLRTNPDGRGFDSGGSPSDGLLGKSNSARGFAWGFRSLVDAAAYVPDDHPLKTYFVERVDNNLRWSDEWGSAFPVPPTGVMFTDTRGSNDTQIAVWMHSYLGWSLDHANEQHFIGGEALLTGLAGFQSKLATSDPDYPREYLTPYYLQVGTLDGSGECCNFFQSMSELFDANYSPGDDPSSYTDDSGGAARLMLIVRARGIYGIFSDGFESGDLSDWSLYLD